MVLDGVSLPQVQGGSHSLPDHQPHQQDTAGFGGFPGVSPLPAARHTPGAEGLALQLCPMGEGAGEVQEQKPGLLNRPGNKRALTGEAGDLNSLNLDSSPGSAFPLYLFAPQSPPLSSAGSAGERMLGGREAGTSPVICVLGNREGEGRK